MEVPVSCNKDCGGGCPLTAVVENGRVVKIKDSIECGKFMTGCLRGYRAHRLTHHRNRLKSPLILDRSIGTHREAGWNEALDYTAAKLERIKNDYGPAAVIRLGGSGSCRGALHNTAALTSRFLNLFGGFTETTGSYSCAAMSFVTPYVYGTQNAAVDAATLTDSKRIILLGANIADLRFGAELMNRLKQARLRGVEITVIDPRKTATVAQLDAEWIPINPGTDAALLASLIFELDETGGLDEAAISRYCSGFRPFRDWLYSTPVKSPEWAADICGIPAGKIRRIADDYRRFTPLALIPGLSVQRTLGGEDAARMAMVLQSVTGNTGISGGSSGGNIWGSMPKVRCGRINMMPECIMRSIAAPEKRYIPVYTWPDFILDQGADPPVKAAYNCGGNYLTQGSDTNKSVRAYESLEFSVTHDLFLTPTASRSDVVFPAADFLERCDIVFPEGNFLLWSQKAVEPPPGVKTDYEIFSLLADRMNFGDKFTEGRTEMQWLDFFLEQSEVPDSNEFKRRGVFFGADNRRVGLSDFIASPEENPLNTPSGKIEISSEEFRAAGGNLFPVYTEYHRPGKIRLVTPHSRYRINSQFANTGNKKCRTSHLLVNRGDAALLGISQGEAVIITGVNGSTRAEAVLTDDIIAGTASLDAGSWESGSANMVTSSEPTMPSGGSRTHSTFVDIRPV